MKICKGFGRILAAAAMTGPAIILSVLLITVPRSATAGDWRAMSPAKFPAQVRSITVGSLAMDSGHSVSWGAWGVRFTSVPPIARHTTVEGPYNSPGDFSISIGPLECVNRIEGASSCFLNLMRIQGSFACIIIPKPEWVGCPSDLVLD